MRKVLLCWLFVAACSACDRRPLEHVGEAGTPLVVMLSPEHGRAVRPEQLAALGDYLTREAGLQVTVWVAPSETAAMQAVAANQIDAGLLPLADFLFLHQEYGVHASLRVLREQGSAEYRGEFVVRGDSGIASIADLAGKKVAFVDGNSTSGFLLPARMLADAHVKTEAVFAGSHEGAVDLLTSHQVDAAVTHTGGRLLGPSVKVIATTVAVPNEPVFFRKSLAADKRERVAAALTRYAVTADGAQVLAELAGITGFAPTSDSAYAEVFDTLKEAGKRVEDMVADGWKIAASNQRPLSSYAP